MSNNIVVLSGSPRKNGNTDRLAGAFAKGAESVGKNVIFFRVADMNINGCLGCEYCFGENSVCVQQDDMAQILDAIRAADTLVLASPVYFYDMSAQLKLAIDRMYALLCVGVPVKKSALFMVCGDDSDTVADGAVITYKNICEYYEWEDAGVIIATELHRPGEIDGRDELEMAWKLGLMI